MSDPIFTAEYFNTSTEYIHCKQAAERANDKLESLLGPAVFGLKQHNWEWKIQQNYNGTDTHTARLFNVQEIKKKECRHEPTHGIESIVEEFNGDFMFECRCGAKLKANWTEVKE